MPRTVPGSLILHTDEPLFGFAQFRQVGRSIEKKIAHAGFVRNLSLGKANSYNYFGLKMIQECGSKIAHLFLIVLSSEK